MLLEKGQRGIDVGPRSNCCQFCFARKFKKMQRKESLEEEGKIDNFNRLLSHS